MKERHFNLLIGSGWTACLLFALLVVNVSFECRILADELMQLKARQQQLQVEWGRLLLEESALAGNTRVEELAQSQLAMRRPGPDDIRVLLP